MRTGKSPREIAEERVAKIRNRFEMLKMGDWCDPRLDCQEMLLQELVDNFNRLPTWAYADLIQMAKEFLEDANGLAKDQ